MNLAEVYIDQVLNDKVLTNKYVKQAVSRHVDDLKKSEDPAYKFYFDPAAGLRAIQIAKLHKHTAGAMALQPFDLQPFQAFILYVVFGWKRRSNNKRRFTKAYIEMARKNGKSEFAGVVANIGVLFDKEYGAEVYTAATKRDQAKIVFDKAKTMLENLRKDSRAIASLVRILKHNVSVPTTKSKLEALASEAHSLDGLNPHIAIIDEYHAHKDNTLVKVLETGQGSRSQPLLFIITTAGFNIESPCYNFRKVCTDILSGRVELDNVFCIIYTLDEGDDWKDPANWIKSNPNLGTTPTIENMTAALNTALVEGEAAEVEFKTKNLNVWTQTSVTFISDEDWIANGTKFDYRLLENRPAFGGLDIGAVDDLTAFSLFFPAIPEDPVNRVLIFFFMPAERIDVKSRLHRVDYRPWIKNGYIVTTPGNATDYNAVKDYIGRLALKYDIYLTAYDAWNQLTIIPDLLADGAELIPFRQGYKSMTGPTKLLKSLTLDRLLDHRNNPVLRWMMSNVLLLIDPAGNWKLDRSKKRQKIDGPVALIMSIGAWLEYKKENKDSIYDKEDIKTL